MSSIFQDNTYLTDLKVGDKVIEKHKSTGLQYISTVKSIDNEKIVVTRDTDKKDYSYGTSSAMIMYPYGTKVADFYLLQYQYTTEGTPFNPGPVASDAEALIPPYGLDATK